MSKEKQNEFKVALQNFLKDNGMAQTPAEVQKYLDQNSEEGLAGAFDEAMHYCQSEENMLALSSLLAVLEFVNRNTDMLAADELLGYNLDSASIIGHIFWDEEEIELATAAFEYGIHLIESCFEDISKAALDPHEVNDAAVLYIVEDYASINYALGKMEEAKKYYQMLEKLDSHNHLNADVALDCINEGLSWDDAVERLDAASGDSDCDCGEDSSAHSDQKE